MALNKYRVEYLTPNGELIRAIQIGTAESITDELTDRGFTVLKCERYFELSLRRKEPLVIAFFKNLKSLLSAGYSLNRAVFLLVNAENNLTFQKVISDVREGIERGGSFSDSLSLHPEHFSLPVRMIVKSGEQSGKMLTAIEDALGYMQQELSLKKGVISKMAGPLVVLAIGIMALFFNTLYTIPKIMNTEFFQQIMAKQVGFALTLIKITTRVVPLMGIVFLLLAAGLVYAYRIYQDQVERMLLKVPVIKDIFFNKEVFLIYFTLSRLIRAGIRVEEAVLTVKQGIRLKSVRDEFDRVLSLIRSGKTFYQSFPLLDEVETALLSGATSAQKLAEVFELVAQRKLDAYSSMVKKLPAICQAFTYGVLIYLFFILFLGIIVPYYKSINVMMSKM